MNVVHPKVLARLEIRGAMPDASGYGGFRVGRPGAGRTGERRSEARTGPGRPPARVRRPARATTTSSGTETLQAPKPTGTETWQVPNAEGTAAREDSRAVKSVISR
ncbi:hypothetical protein JCM9957A_29640 [Kineosporia succinea]